MEHLQRLLGTLQRALDYVSSFTTYLLGDETYPGAEEPGQRRNRSSRCSSHDGEVETAHSGDIPPTRHLEVFEGCLTTEITPANQEIQAASEAADNDAQATESVHKLSKLPIRSEGQEKAEEKLSESSQFPADAPEPSPTAAAISSIKHKDVEGPTATGGLHQWELEGTSWIGGGQQQGALEEVADTEQHQHGEAEGPKGKQLEKQGQEEETSEEREEKQVGTLWYDRTQQIAPDLTPFVGEEQRGLDGMVRAVGFQLSGVVEEGVKMVEGQQLEAERQQENETEMEKDLLEEINMAETEGDQEEMLGAGRSHLWEPEEEVKGTRETDCGQEKELGETLWYEGIQERVPDWSQFVEVQHRGLEEATKMAEDEQLEVEQEHTEDPEAEGQEGKTWAVGFHHRGLEKEEEEVKMANGQELEVKQEQEEEPEVEENLQEELDIAEEEEIQQAMPDAAETEREQDGEPKGIAENRGGQWEEVAGVEETEGVQQREVEEPVRKEAAEEQVEVTGEEWLEESDQESESERPAEASGLLDKEELEAAGVQTKQTEETDSRQQQEPMVCTASITGTFPVKVKPLNTSHQMERVLLRRKSSIRRAPSTKRQPVETTQPETISVAEEVPAQPQTPHRQNPRHSGFGPLHPNMMAELQTRLRKPQ
ncbi:golgin subfamily A member 6-like protein 22 [Zootoca vivipara]|uniref:golgin subfamily A member 6-like protein 22 n=1 Tax=Zootoca vivipara TaxID=8524 RepID=UPI00158FDE98|nr:golgin subfamily A member 6-like protein 22 [Zootoca vivipara]XP_034992098.1 golgin subfamily A member 6-like protein 22 [Zootoca vivipara]XP_034992099.1 golgin subfamily A member 6-like protein 22 [Zootoca vivipara]